MTKLKLFLVLGSVLLATAVIAALNLQPAQSGRWIFELPRTPIPADSRTPLVLRAIPQGRRIPGRAIRVRIVDGESYATVEENRVVQDQLEIRFRPRVLAGNVSFEIAAEGFLPARGEFRTVAVTTDALGDGTPDFLRLGAEDAEAFRNWFTYLAESQYYRQPSRLPAEINDCAALIRFAYRETFRVHDVHWANALDLDDALSFPDIKQYQYPFTPLGAALFRTRSGKFRWDDLQEKVFGQFADAQTLQRFNTHFVSRAIQAARPGDLLFYRQLDQDMPFHAMIFVGRSHFEPDESPRLVYHTGPIGLKDGEIRRPTVAMLLDHPEPRWRPVPGNSNFLGVYRWNILQ